MSPNRPDAAMMEAVGRITRFMETLDEAVLEGAFADRDVTIIENFAPHVFCGDGAVAAWVRGFRAHAAGLSDLRHEFGPAQDFSVNGDLAFFSLPTRWRGMSAGRPFCEDGGWAFVLTRQGEGWRVRNYGWAVTGLVQGGT